MVIGINLKNYPINQKTLYATNINVILDHYYHPLFNPKNLRHSLNEKRNLTGINLNDENQLQVLSTFTYQSELELFPIEIPLDYKNSFYFRNGAYGAGDAECYYSMIRSIKPKKIIEIGSGNSTLIALEAIKKNKEENNNYNCELICIEPYEMDWLEQKEVTVLRQKIEEVNLSYFQQLEENDMLFIDSSHIIRPQGDVLFEYLTLLPTLKKGVYVHVHDILTPSDYPYEWVIEDVRLWNEQYLLEAFLTLNSHFEISVIIGYMRAYYPEKIYEAFSVLNKNRDMGATSFWMKKVK